MLLLWALVLPRTQLQQEQQNQQMWQHVRPQETMELRRMLMTGDRPATTWY
jgi:hypothetical protein